MKVGIAVLVTMLLLSGCEASKDVGVYSYLPLSRLESPEPDPKLFSAGPGAGGMARLELTNDQRVHSPTDAPPDAQLRAMLIPKVSVTPLPVVSGSLKGYNGVFFAPQVKVMPLAALAPDSPLSLAVTMAYGKFHEQYDYDSTSNNDPDAHTTMHEWLRDTAVIAGWRTSRAVMVYGGVFRTSVNYKGTYRSNTVPARTYEQESVASGANLGLAWNVASWARVLAEVSAAHVRTGDDTEEVLTPGISGEFFFGSWPWRRRPSRPEEPVEVVPVEEPPR